MANFNASKHDAEEIHHIAKTFKRFRPNYPDDLLTLEMDLMACHANGNALDLFSLGEAVFDLEGMKGRSVDVLHDIYGIRKNINRKTGKLENFFVPRFSA